MKKNKFITLLMQITLFVTLVISTQIAFAGNGSEPPQDPPTQPSQPAPPPPEEPIVCNPEGDCLPLSKVPFWWWIVYQL